MYHAFLLYILLLALPFMLSTKGWAAPEHVRCKVVVSDTHSAWKQLEAPEITFKSTHQAMNELHNLPFAFRDLFRELEERSDQLEEIAHQPTETTPAELDAQAETFKRLATAIQRVRLQMYRNSMFAYQFENPNDFLKVIDETSESLENAYQALIRAALLIEVAQASGKIEGFTGAGFRRQVRQVRDQLIYVRSQNRLTRFDYVKLRLAPAFRQMN